MDQLATPTLASTALPILVFVLRHSPATDLRTMTHGCGHSIPARSHDCCDCHSAFRVVVWLLVSDLDRAVADEVYGADPIGDLVVSGRWRIRHSADCHESRVRLVCAH